MLDINKTHNMDCVAGMELLDEQSIDLVVTSPPYDHLRSYDGYSFDYKKTAEALLRVVKVGGGSGMGGERRNHRRRRERHELSPSPRFYRLRFYPARYDDMEKRYANIPRQNAVWTML